MLQPLQTVYSYPLIVNRRKGVLAILTILSATLLSYLFIQHILMPIFCFLLVTMPIVTFVFPTTYRFYETEFEKEQLFYPVKIPYDRFSSFKVFPDGILLHKKRKDEFIYLFKEEERVFVKELLLRNSYKEV